MLRKLTISMKELIGRENIKKIKNIHNSNHIEI